MTRSNFVPTDNKRVRFSHLQAFMDAEFNAQVMRPSPLQGGGGQTSFLETRMMTAEVNGGHSALSKIYFAFGVAMASSPSYR